MSHDEHTEGRLAGGYGLPSGGGGESTETEDAQNQEESGHGLFVVEIHSHLEMKLDVRTRGVKKSDRHSARKSGPTTYEMRASSSAGVTTFTGAFLNPFLSRVTR